MAEIEVRPVADDAWAVWDHAVDASPHGTVYHRSGWLRAAAAHSGTDLHALVAWRGEDIAGLFPFFTRTRGGIRMAFSPPPGCEIPAMGPVLAETPAETSKQEVLLQAVVDGGLRWLATHTGPPDYCTVRTARGLLDTRPFIWAGFDVQPVYTYLFSLEPELEAILAGFNKRIRQYIRSGLRDTQFSVAAGGRDDLLDVNRFIADRYREQGLSYDITDAYLRALHDALPDNLDVITVNHAEDGRLTGLILVNYKGVTSHWIGSPVPKAHTNQANSLLYWGAVERGIAKGMHTCEIIGGTRSACVRTSRSTIPKWA